MNLRGNPVGVEDTVSVIRRDTVEMLLIVSLHSDCNGYAQDGSQNTKELTVLVHPGQTEPEGCRNVARRIMETYDRDSIEVMPMSKCTVLRQQLKNVALMVEQQLQS